MSTLRVCPRCGRSVERGPKARWCSDDCRVRAWQEREILRAEVRANKSARGCMKCGERTPDRLDFHHRDPATKTFGISDAGWRSRDEVFPEIEKCDVLCVSCHSAQHWALRKGALQLPSLPGPSAGPDSRYNGAGEVLWAILGQLIELEARLPSGPDVSRVFGRALLAVDALKELAETGMTAGRSDRTRPTTPGREEMLP